jgi:hypothetical protein
MARKRDPITEKFLEMNENEEDRKRLRKALVVMLYAHFEGTCRTILCLYVDFINNQNLKIGVVGSAAAASLSDFFKALKNLTLMILNYMFLRGIRNLLRRFRNITY